MTSPPSLRVTQIAPGLWRWTCPPSPCAHGEISSVYCETPSAIVLVDPVLPSVGSAEHQRFFRALDADVARLGLPIAVLTTSEPHARDAAALASRYETPFTGGRLPAGVLVLEVHPPASAAERAFWLPSHRALIVGHAQEESARAELARNGAGTLLERLLSIHELAPTGP